MTLDVNLRGNTVWLTQKQMGMLFETERSVITKHVNNILKTGELRLEAVCANLAHTAEDGKTYQTKRYNLDMILSVGYRVNSKRGTQFRIWATNVLRDHILKGYSINEKRLKELNKAIRLIADIADRKSLTGDEATALLRVVADYSRALDLLDDYDHNSVRTGKVTVIAVSAVSYKEAIRMIKRLRHQFGAGDLFGLEKDDSLKGSLANIMQTSNGGGSLPGPRRKGCTVALFSCQEPFVCRRKQTNRRSPFSMVSRKEWHPLQRRWFEADCRQCAGSHDTAHRRKLAGRKGHSHPSCCESY